MDTSRTSSHNSRGSVHYIHHGNARNDSMMSDHRNNLPQYQNSNIMNESISSGIRSKSKSNNFLKSLGKSRGRSNYSQRSGVSSNDYANTSGRYHQPSEESLAHSRNDTENFFERDYFNMPFDDSTSGAMRQDRGDSGYRSRNESGQYSRADTSDQIEKIDWRKAWETPNNA